MYIPPYYKNNNLEEIKQFIRDNAFAVLISNGKNAPDASHIPLELIEESDGHSFLQGHVSRGNPQWKNFSSNDNVLAIFQGPHSYISSGWYNHINVPTWNYIAVHVTGKIEIVEEGEMYESLKKLVDHYESGSEKPVKVEEMPHDMMEKYMKGIVGFKIQIEKIEGKWKLSQNRDDEDYKNIIDQLQKLNDINAGLVAEEMKKLKK